MKNIKENKPNYLLNQQHTDVNKRDLLKELDIIDNHQLCLNLNISNQTAYRWRKTGRLPYIQISRKFFYRRTDVDKLVQKHYTDDDASTQQQPNY